MWLKSIVSAALVALFTLPAVAQAPTPQGTPTRVRGTIENFDGKTLTVKTREGAEVAVTLADDVKVLSVRRVKLSQIKQGDFIGTAALADAAGKLHAQEIQVLPEAMRGAGEGHYPWDLTPGSTMTNGTVAEVARVSRDRVLHLTYKDGTQDIEVSPGTPIVTFVPGTTKLLKPGRAVVVFSRKMADGGYVAGALALQSGKVKPPM
jgi:hypothetical protein